MHPYMESNGLIGCYALCVRRYLLALSLFSFRAKQQYRCSYGN
jgi:hypothetical protein